MHGDGISKTITDITMVRIALAAHGTGADITIRSTVHSTALITVRTIAHTGVHGAMALCITDITATTTLGTTEDIGADTGDGMTHGTTTIAAGTPRTTTIILAGLHTSLEVHPAAETHITVFVPVLNPPDRLPQAIVHQARHQVR